jgi:carboxylate-amine ligase
MMSRQSPLHLFEGYGIELEYMIVDRDSLAVRPVSDRLLQRVAGKIVNELEAGPLCWSNELVLHVLELKTNGPAASLVGLADLFHAGVLKAQEQLAPLHCRLLGTAMHPLMDPHRETVLWPHENSPIYDAYNRIFGCRGHGWSNVQSMHINLPFADDEEFGRLHAAIRLVLPLLPALAASSPLVDGRLTGLLDNRLEFYRNNQLKIPEIAGQIIPEAVFSRADYEQQILAITYRAIAPFDVDGVLQEEWLNSRGAIARFERDAIEIRVLDTQECPKADLAIAAIIVSLVQALCNERWQSQRHQREVPVDPLAELFRRTLQGGGADMVNDPAYLACFGVLDERISVAGLWHRIYEQLEYEIPEEYRSPLELILRRGPLAQRILDALPRDFGPMEIVSLYRQLADCLLQGELYHG